jgi:hypothetical protein
MIEAFLVYFSLMFIMLFLAMKGGFVLSEGVIENIENQKFAIISLVSIFIFSLVIGLRYYVGGDYVGYLDDYNSFNIANSFKDSRYELGYYSLMYLLKFLSLSYPFLFLTVSFLQILFVYKWAKNYKYLLPWIVFFYFTTLYLFESMNVMRQALAFSILLFSTIYIQKTQLIRFILLVLLAASFHKSALSFVIFYFLINREWIKNKYIQLGLLFISLISSQFLFETFFQKIDVFATLLDYDSYSQMSSDLFLADDNDSLGFGLFFLVSIDSIIILYSDRLQKTFKNEKFYIYYNLFFIGALLSATFSNSNSIALGRLMFYFVSFRIVILSFLSFYLFKINRSLTNNIVGILIIVTYLFWFISAISKGAAWSVPFQFIFQDFNPNR